MKNNIFFLIIYSFFFFSCNKKVDAPLACIPIPTDQQMVWQQMEYYAFIHFSMNTFTGAEWEYGDKDPQLFNPSELDCEQWARVCKDAGMKGIILTCKHHDGFTLWPSAFTEYSVKNSPWRNGKGDLVAELSAACKKEGLKFGVYLSPWDRNHPEYGRPEYITYFRNQLRELLTNYGDIFEVWFDGANGGTGYYGGAKEHREIDRLTYYDWDNTFKMIYELQPNAAVFGCAGPDVRWCGNESGWSGETCWSTLNKDDYGPGLDNYPELNDGNEGGSHWVPSEVDVSIRPGWFYRESEDDKVHSLEHLVNIYYNSVGRNATLLLNFPVDKRGLIHENDVESVIKLADVIEADFNDNLALRVNVSESNIRGNSKEFSGKQVIDGDENSYWTTDDTVLTASLTLNLDKPTKVNRFLVQEYIRLGQRVKAFTVEAFVDGVWQEIASETTIGYKRILRFPTVTTTQIRFNVTDSKACPTISNIELYHASEDWKGENLSLKHTHKKLASDNWTFMGDNKNEFKKLFDGKSNTVFYQKGKAPIDLVFDMGNLFEVNGFRYLPDQSESRKGVVFNYQFAVSTNGIEWKIVSEGEFSNIQNNPIWQEKSFEKTDVRYVKFTMLSNANQDDIGGYAEFEILTK